ncbi:Protein transport protein Sec61 subunit beta [Trichoplax sp. H2]|nr:Protein transport protein Sec61 subunit beta [Trichoplax sp. H2]|eukprot:RDD37111.1 Protein transport protein Sec61 subunit beta [Trichoplax sp. H2]
MITAIFTLYNKLFNLFQPTSPSSTSVGSGRAAAGGKSPVKGASGVRQRKPTGGGAGGAAPRVGSAGAATSWRFFTEDSPGFKVEPVPVLVMRS